MRLLIRIALSRYITQFSTEDGDLQPCFVSKARESRDVDFRILQPVMGLMREREFLRSRPFTVVLSRNEKRHTYQISDDREAS